MAARAVRPCPEVGIVEHAPDEPATTIVAQHPAARAIVHERHGASATGHLFERSAPTPVVAIEDLFARLVDARAIV